MQNYLKIARPDHWIKNVAILPGILLACTIGKPQDLLNSLVAIILAFLSAILIGSSNYTINELLDANEDKHHPSRNTRPVPAGKIIPLWGYLQWFLLAAGGLSLAWFENKYFFLTALVFFVMGILYNVKPFRTKDVVYLDVLSESINSPLRFLLGWFAMKSSVFPPVSLLMSFWMIGAFFMSAKRIAELRFINNPLIASSYRRPFKYYNQDRLISCAIFYATNFGVFTGIFLIKYRIELILGAPFISGLLAAYMFESFKENSEMRRPEKLYKQNFLMGYLLITTIIIVICFNIRLTHG